VFSPLAEMMIKPENLGVAATILAFGVGFLVICAVSALFVVNPYEGFVPKGFTPAQQAAVTRRQYTPKEIIRTKQYYLLAGGLLFTLPAYFMLVPVFRSLGVDRGLIPELAVLGVMITGIGSASGRLIVSWVSDKIGRKGAMVAIAVLILAASLVMIVAEGVLFLVCITLISFGFGGASSVYAAMTAESFGTKNVGMNFGLVMLGFGVSALLFQNISKALAAGGNYTASFIIAAATCAAAIVVVLLLDNPSKLAEAKKD
jgi:OFA family oxalate/formate antiporter-like MFS transporter